MDSSHIGQLIGLILLIFGSAFFSAAETAFLSANRIRMKNLAATGNDRAQLVLDLSEKYDKLLSTILVGNNVVNIVATSLSTLLFASLIKSADLAVTVSTVVMTLAVLIFGEITPKTLAKQNAEQFSLFVAPFLQFMVRLLTPLTALFLLWQHFVTRHSGQKEESVTEDEILTMVEEATEGGGIDENEGELIRNAIRFNDLDVSDVLTPRVDMVAVDDSWSREKVDQVFAETEFSRIPVYHGTVDNIIGVINLKDFHAMDDFDLPKLVKPVKFIYSSMKISRLLKLLQETKSHLCVVTDEYGGTEGIVTLEDVLESLVGEIYDEHDEVVLEWQTIGDHEFLVDGSAGLVNFFERFHLGEAPDGVTTVGGFVIDQMGKIPSVGETFTYGALTLTVTKTDYRRVLEVRVTEEVPPEDEE